jgi:hypothetical protein
MLKGVEISKTAWYGEDKVNPVNPYSVKGHVDSLSDSKKEILVSQMAAKLYYMQYLKNLESVIALYDCYNFSEESNVDNYVDDYELSSGANIAALLTSGLFLYRRRANLLNFGTYFSNIYPLIGIYGFSYFAFKIIFGSPAQAKYPIKQEIIKDTYAKAHTDAVKINNMLRFNAAEI